MATKSRPPVTHRHLIFLSTIFFRLQAEWTWSVYIQYLKQLESCHVGLLTAFIAAQDVTPHPPCQLRPVEQCQRRIAFFLTYIILPPTPERLACNWSLDSSISAFWKPYNGVIPHMEGLFFSPPRHKLLLSETRMCSCTKFVLTVLGSLKTLIVIKRCSFSVGLTG